MLVGSLATSTQAQQPDTNWAVTIEAEGESIATNTWGVNSTESWAASAPRSVYQKVADGAGPFSKTAGRITFKFQWMGQGTPPLDVWVKKWAKASITTEQMLGSGSATCGLNHAVEERNEPGEEEVFITHSGTDYVRKLVRSGQFQVNFDMVAQGTTNFGQMTSKVMASAAIAPIGLEVQRQDGGIEKWLRDDAIDADTVYSYPEYSETIYNEGGDPAYSTFLYQPNRPNNMPALARLHGPWLTDSLGMPLATISVFGPALGLSWSYTNHNGTVNWSKLMKAGVAGSSTEEWSTVAADAVFNAGLNYKWTLHNLVEDVEFSKTKERLLGEWVVGYGTLEPGKDSRISSTVTRTSGWSSTVESSFQGDFTLGMGTEWPVFKDNVDKAEVKLAWGKKEVVTDSGSTSIAVTTTFGPDASHPPGVYALYEQLVADVQIGTASVWSRQGLWKKQLAVTHQDYAKHHTNHKWKYHAPF